MEPPVARAAEKSLANSGHLQPDVLRDRGVSGVSEERTAKSLNVDVARSCRRRELLDGIRTESAELLKEKHTALNSFSELRRLRAIRQIEAAELTLAMNNFSNSYVRALVAATPKAQLAPGYRPSAPKGCRTDRLP
jgi:hypothetical protein